MKKNTFEEWCKTFENSPKGKDALELVIDVLYPSFVKAVEGDPAEDAIKLVIADFKDWILKACYNAYTFEDKSREKRIKDKDSLSDIRDKGRNPIKAIKELQGFFKKYPNTANEVIGHALFDLRNSNVIIGVKDGESMPTQEVFSTILEAFKKGLEQYSLPTNLAHWSYAGCLSFPKPMEQKRDDIAVDSLIFELATLIRLYKKNPGSIIINRGMPLPPRIRLAEQNQIIAELVNATFPANTLDARKVKQRLDALKKDKAVYVGWDYIS